MGEQPTVRISEDFVYNTARTVLAYRLRDMTEYEEQEYMYKIESALSAYIDTIEFLEDASPELRKALEKLLKDRLEKMLGAAL